MNKSTQNISLSGSSFLDSLRSRKSVHLLDTIVLTYICVCTLWFCLDVIMPFFYMTEKTPLRNFPLWLRVIGVILILAQVIMVSPRRRAPRRFFLYGICLSALIASFIHIKYGFINNFRNILLMFIVFVLFYGSSYGIPKKKMRTFLAILYALLAAIWFVACCLSLVQFALQIGTDGPNHATSIWLRGSGYMNDRLTGVFGFPEYGGITGLMMFVAGIFWFLKTENRLVRAVLIIANVPVYLYIVLCGSRNTALAFFEVAFVGTYLLTRKYFRKTAEKGFLACLGMTVAGLLISIVLYIGTGKIAGLVPHILGTYEEPATEESAFLPDSVSGSADSITAFEDSEWRINSAADIAEVLAGVSGTASADSAQEIHSVSDIVKVFAGGSGTASADSAQEIHSATDIVKVFAGSSGTASADSAQEIHSATDIVKVFAGSSGTASADSAQEIHSVSDIVKVFAGGSGSAGSNPVKKLMAAITRSGSEKTPAVTRSGSEKTPAVTRSVTDSLRDSRSLSIIGTSTDSQRDSQSPAITGASAESLRNFQSLSITMASTDSLRDSQSPAITGASAESDSSKEADSTKTTKSPKSTKSADERGIETEDNTIFNRTYRDGDFSTGRLKIWRNYFRMWKEIGVFGLSPENTGYYVQEHHPKMYIVTSPEINTPEAAATGYVFHPHNGYIKVYASAGFLGTFMMLAFLGCALFRIIKWIVTHETLSPEFIILTLILMIGASAAMFDMELFFVYNPPTFLFWLCMSLLFRVTAPPVRKKNRAAAAAAA